MPRLGLGLGLGIRTGAAPWSPDSVSGLTFRWDWTTGKFTDGTGITPPPVTPVTADGDRIGWWADAAVSQYAIATLNATACRYRPTGGPSTGKAGVEWNGTTDQGSFVTAGSTVIPAASSFSMLVIAKNAGATGRSAICGRGFNLEGCSLQFDSSNRITGTIRAAAVRTATGPVVAPGDWGTFLLSYDGTTPRLISRTGGVTTAAAATATSGPIAFHASDTSFYIGSFGTTFNQNGGKTIAQILIASSNYDATTGAAYVNNASTYAGLP